MCQRWKGFFFHHNFCINLYCVLWSFWVINTFCMYLLGPHNVQVFPICYKLNGFKICHGLIWISIKKNTSNFAKKPSPRPRKVIGMAIMAQNMWTCGGAFTQIHDSYTYSIHFKSHIIPIFFGIQAYDYFYYKRHLSLALQGCVPSPQNWAIT